MPNPSGEPTHGSSVWADTFWATSGGLNPRLDLAFSRSITGRGVAGGASSAIERFGMLILPAVAHINWSGGAVALEPFVGDHGARNAPAQAFEFSALMPAASHPWRKAACAAFFQASLRPD